MTWDGQERRDVIALGVMCKAPRPGVSKTRLAATIGPEFAAELAGAFIKDVFHTLSIVQRRTSVALFVFYAPEGADDEIASYVPARIPRILQSGQDLGAEMLGALQTMLEVCPKGALLMGSDVPTLPVDTLVAAVAALRRAEDRVVIGPSSDGGYYLIGANSNLVAPLFDGIAWSSPSVMTQTRSRARNLGINLVEVDTWYDVDDAQSLAKLKATLAVTTHDVAPATRALLLR